MAARIWGASTRLSGRRVPGTWDLGAGGLGAGIRGAGILGWVDLQASAGLGHRGGVGELVGEYRHDDEGHSGGQGAVGRARPAVAHDQAGLSQDIGLVDPGFHVHVGGHLA